MRLALRLLFVVVIPVVGFAQDSAVEKLRNEKTPWMFVGGYVDYNRNYFKAEFPAFPNLATCNEMYRSGTGHGVAIGVLADYIMSPTLSVAARFGYADVGGALSNYSVIGYTSQLGSNQQLPDRVETQYALSASIHAVTFEPSINTTFFGKVRVGAGLRAAFLASSSFEEAERIVRPDYVFFVPDSTRTRLQRSGDIPNVNPVQLAPTIGVAVDVPLSPKWTLAPEIRYQMALNNISDVNWSVSTIQFGVSLRTPLYKTPPPIIHRDTVVKRDTNTVSSVSITQERVMLKESTTDLEQTNHSIDDQAFVDERLVIRENYTREVPRTARLSVNVEAYTVAATGERLALEKFVVEENEIEENYSLLPQVFFPDGESRLERTSMAMIEKSRVSSFTESTLPKSTLDVYHELLNIVGLRMRESPAEKITLVGCNSSVGAEKNNLDLSKARAESVRSYLENVWGIEPSRVTIKAQNLPTSPANIAYEEGQAENRRVDILTDNPDLLRAVAIKNSTVRSTPRHIDIVPSIISEAGIQNWSARVVQGDKILREYGGQNVPEKYTWNVSDEPYPRMEKPVSATYTVTDKTGNRKDATVSMEVQQLSIKQKRFEQKDDKRIDRFSLIVFDFNKADLNADNKRIVAEVKSRIQTNSVVTIAGYADKSGDAEYNRDLARRRCLEVEKIISGPGIAPLISPIGSDILLYDNASPEGRAYCRTVQIVIETPVK